MKLQNKIIVITGGTSGIGFELVKQLSNCNQLFVIARPGNRLTRLAEQFPNIVTIACDLSHLANIELCADQIVKATKRIDVLINNAAVQNTPTFLQDDFNYDAIQPEITLNFTAVCTLSYLLLPALLNNPNQTVITNINSGLALAPKTSSAVYCATKAAVNAFSESLQYQLESTNVKVSQAFLPLVDTAMTWGRGSNKISAEQAATAIIAGIEDNKHHNDIGKVKLLRLLLLFAPLIAKKMMRGY